MYTTELTRFENDLCQGVKEALDTMTGLASIKGWVNGVSRPKDPYIMFTIHDMMKLSTNSTTYDLDSEKMFIRSANKINIQLDVYAPNAFDVASFLQVALMSEEAAQIFKKYGFSVLYTDDLVNTSSLNESKKFDQRYTLYFWVQFAQAIKQDAIPVKPRIHYKKF